MNEDEKTNDILSIEEIKDLKDIFIKDYEIKQDLLKISSAPKVSIDKEVSLPDRTFNIEIKNDNNYAFVIKSNESFIDKPIINDIIDVSDNKYIETFNKFITNHKLSLKEIENLFDKLILLIKK